MLIAKVRIKIDPKATDWILPNEKFDAPKDLAKTLIEKGYAVDEATKAAPAPVVATPTGPSVTVNQSPATKAE